MQKLTISVLSIGVNILALALPLALLQVYDRIVPNQSWGSAVVIFGATVLALIGAGFLRYVRSAIFARAGAMTDHRQDLDLAARVLGKRTDTQTKRMMVEALGRARDLSVGQGAIAYYDAPFALVFLALVWFLGGVVALVPLAVIAVVLVFLAVTRPRYRRDMEQAARLSAQADISLHDLVERGQQHQALQSVGPAIMPLLDLKRRHAAVMERINAADTRLLDIQQSVGLIGTVGIVGIGAGLALSGQMTSGGLAACTLLGSRAIAQGVGVLMARFRRDAVISAALRATREGSTQEDALLAGIVVGAAPGVTVVAPEKVGGWAALHGAHAPDHVSFVPRKPHFLRGTLLENMSGFSRAREDTAAHVASQLGLDRMTDHFSEGYRTMVGAEREMPLSQGGGVRLAAITRALVSPADHVVLADPTRDLDPSSIQRLRAVLHDAANSHRSFIVIGADDTLGIPPAAEPEEQANVA